jgi:hypothetical protein
MNIFPSDGIPFNKDVNPNKDVFFLDSFLIILFLCRIKIFKQAFQNNHACGL